MARPRAFERNILREIEKKYLVKEQRKKRKKKKRGARKYFGKTCKEWKNLFSGVFRSIILGIEQPAPAPEPKKEKVKIDPRIGIFERKYAEELVKRKIYLTEIEVAYTARRAWEDMSPNDKRRFIDKVEVENFYKK